MYNYRIRSGSVGRGERENIPYRTSYGRDTSTSNRMSRASSYDPFAGLSRNTVAPSLSRTDRTYSRPCYSGMSHSFHYDFTPTKNYITMNRYGSTDHLLSFSSHKASFNPTSVHGLSHKASTAFAPLRSGSLGTGFCLTDSSAPRFVRDYNLSCSRDLSSNASATKFRSDTTSSYRPSFSASTSYIPRVRFEYRSKTPGYMTSDSLPRSNRLDRDYKSMSRFEKAPPRESVESTNTDDVESTFQKLYDRYVKKMESDDEDENGGNSRIRQFISHSEAEEEASSDEEGSTSECDSSFAEKLKEINERKKAEINASITPNGSIRNSPASDLVTPTCSPMMPRKKEPKDEDLTMPELSIVTEKEMAIEKTKTAAQLFQEKYCDIELQPAILPSRQLKPVASAMDKMLKKDSLTTKLTEAIEKKKSETPISTLGHPLPNVSLSISKKGCNFVSNKEDGHANFKEDSRKIDPNQAIIQPTKLSALTIDNGKATAGQSAKLQANNTNIKPALLPITNSRLSPSKTFIITEDSDSLSCLLSKSTPIRNSNSIPSNQIMEKRLSERSTTLPLKELDSVISSAASPTNALNNTPVFYENKSLPPPNPEILVESIQTEEPTTDVTISINSIKKVSYLNKLFDSGLPIFPYCIKSHFCQIRSRSSSPAKLRRTEKSHEGIPQSLAPTSINTCGLKDGRDERSKSVGDPVKKIIRRRRDLSRTLDCLKEKLKPLLREKQVEEEREDSVTSEEAETVSELCSHPRPPLLMVTQPSVPSTPMSTSANIIWNHSSDGEWTETEDEVDYESDFEYSVSQTFSLHGARPLGDLYPLSPSSSHCSPFVSDYDSDSSMPLFVESSRQLDSRGRVDRLFAVPPPIFTCSITYDGQESWDEDSLHSCEDYYDEDYGCYSSFGRPSSSSLGVYMSPATYSSDEDYDGQHFHESVQVGCTLRLVDRAAMKDTDDEYTDSEYYDDEEYSDDEYWDEDEDYDECSEYDEEELDENQSTDEERSLSPLIVAHPVEIEEDEMEYEVMDGDFEVDASFALVESKEVEREEGKTKKHREITYTQDLPLVATEEYTEKLQVVQEEAVKAKSKTIKKDGTTGKAEKTQITQRVLPAAESVEEASVSILPEEELIGLNVKEHEDQTGTNEVNVVPTYVRPQTEKITEECTSRFADKKARTDFAKKAVIQPPKLQVATVQKVETKMAQENAKIEITNKENNVKNGSVKIAILEKPCEEPQKTNVMTTSTKLKEIKADKTPLNPQEVKPTIKEVEDKSGVRKSALNMTIEEAKKKATADEEVAKQKARRLGTVSAMMDRFKENEKKEEPIIYKRSTRLAPKDEAPRKKYEVVKPVLNDEFDKQMEEIRQQMRAGSNQFQNQIKDLSKGISIVSEEAKKRSEDEKHKNLLSKATGVFSKAAEEKSRWKEKRVAESEKELTKIDSEKSLKKIKSLPQQQKEEVKTEPKRTVRKINKEKSPVTSDTTASKSDVTKTTASCPSFAVMPVIEAPKLLPPTATAMAPPSMTTSVKPPEVKNNAMINKSNAVEKPKILQQGVIINDDNYDLFEAATVVATRRRKSLAEMRAKKEQRKITEASADIQPKVPKGDGAAATKIRNIFGNVMNTRKPEPSSEKTSMDNEKSAKRYSTRRKTQEIVNESVELKMKRRKQVARKNKFIRNTHDIDVLLGWEKENTFDLMEMFFAKSVHDRIISMPLPKRRRIDAKKIWISDLTDIDKIYKSSEIRDIIASVNM